MCRFTLQKEANNRWRDNMLMFVGWLGITVGCVVYRDQLSDVVFERLLVSAKKKAYLWFGLQVTPMPDFAQFHNPF